MGAERLQSGVSWGKGTKNCKCNHKPHHLIYSFRLNGSRNWDLRLTKRNIVIKASEVEYYGTDLSLDSKDGGHPEENVVFECAQNSIKF